MVKITSEQANFLPRLQAGRALMDRKYAQIDAQARVARAAARDELGVLVKQALALNIPARQIALKGLGYADVGSLKQFMNADGNSLGGAIIAPIELIPTGPRLVITGGALLKNSEIMLYDGTADNIEIKDVFRSVDHRAHSQAPDYIQLDTGIGIDRHNPQFKQDAELHDLFEEYIMQELDVSHDLISWRYGRPTD